MKIFYAFLVIVSATFLFMLPITEMVYDFRTDVRQDSFTVLTGDINSANTTLLKAVFDNDTNTISYTSSIAEEPNVSSYNTTTRQLLTAGLTANTTRTLIVQYDVAALNDAESLDAILNRVPLIWLLMIIAFAPAALASMFVGRN